MNYYDNKQLIFIDIILLETDLKARSYKLIDLFSKSYKKYEI